tara:strand:+ start:411 stop:917 length:507 start_codon:yes stop_codon:yes gene_type:complete
MKPSFMGCVLLLLFSFSIIFSSSAVSEESKYVSLSEEVIITVDSTNLRFSPSEVTITEGDVVRFFWQGQLLAHNAVEKNEVFDSGEPGRNVDYSFTFEIGMNGTYEFVCEPHEEANMVGTITVNPLIIENEDAEEKKERTIPGFSILLLLTSLVAAGILERRRDYGDF